ncbi:MAG TPA: VWA domain-containing protein, partial [Anaerovoracaceae bacterium]|nr:VWA domain-containing protein [Anaerovoracaceae bacterium]
MKAVAKLTFDKIAFNKDNDLHLVVSLTAPKLNWQAERRPILVMPVIDISGSMQGSKLDYAKESVCKLIDHLQPGDFIGIVTFESNVELVSPPVEITQQKKEELKNKVKRLETRGCTAFHGGLLLALEQANKVKLSDDVLVRIIMFTDGQANVGLKGREIVNCISDSMLGRVSISAFGYGSDADQELLADLSVKAKGNYAFIRNPDEAPAAFAKELGGLLSTYATNIVVDVMPEGENKLNILSEVKTITDKSLLSMRVPEILSEEVRNLVLDLKVLRVSQADQLAEAFTSPVAKIRVSYDTLQDGVNQTHTEELLASVTFVNPGEEQTKPTTDVDSAVALAQMVKAQVEAEKQAAAGNYQVATASMNAMADSLN